MFRFILILALLFSFSNCEAPKPKLKAPPIRGQVKLLKVVDGDTIQVIDQTNTKITVRLLLVDTPETKDPRKPVEPFGPEAFAFVTNTLAKAKTIQLEEDIGGQDKYKRKLAHVYADNRNVNKLLLESGYARYAYQYKKYKHIEEYKQAESAARNLQKNIWSIPGYVQADGFHPEVARTRK